MRKLQLWVSALFLITAIALSPFFVGCDEDEPGLGNVDGVLAQNDTENQDREDGLIPLTISPTLASVSYAGERISLRAKGAILPVTWSPANYAAATVTVVGPRSDYAVYQAITLVPNSVLAVDAAGRTATMNITVGTIDSLKIIPDLVTVSNAVGDTINFIASGGAPPYGSWATTFTNLGTIAGGTYTVLGDTGTNLITVTDAAGDIATASVIQQ